MSPVDLLLLILAQRWVNCHRGISGCERFGGPLLSVDVGIPTRLEKLKEEDLPFLCESAAADACAPGNPREASLADFEAMFRKLM